jgi:hypothetical protein
MACHAPAKKPLNAAQNPLNAAQNPLCGGVFGSYEFRTAMAAHDILRNILSRGEYVAGAGHSAVLVFCASAG